MTEEKAWIPAFAGMTGGDPESSASWRRQQEDPETLRARLRPRGASAPEGGSPEPEASSG